ncbi:MAG: hypothetical protein ACYC5X_02655 [Syntrophales bacterium]
MPDYGRVLVTLVISVLLCSGCYPLAMREIQPASLRLPGLTRVLIAEARPQGFSFELRPFRLPLILPGLTVVAPPQESPNAVSLNGLVKTVIKAEAVGMAMVVSPVVTVEHRYNPYQVFQGWRTETIREGRTDRISERPIYETRYTFVCTRTNYRIYQYDQSGNLMGAALMQPDNPRQCPETTDANIHFDEIGPTAAWLEANLRAK